MGTDVYDRTLVIITREGKHNINYMMVEYGWAFPYYGEGNPPNSCLESAQRHAMTHSMGLWSTAPNGGTRSWLWRSQNSKPMRKQHNAPALAGADMVQST